jgi:hypothetical protein
VDGSCPFPWSPEEGDVLDFVLEALDLLLEVSVTFPDAKKPQGWDIVCTQ